MEASWVAFKDCAQFFKHITKIHGTTIDDAEDLNLVRPMYSLLEYSSNFSDTGGNLLFISKTKHLIFMLILKIMIFLNPSSIKLN